MTDNQNERVEVLKHILADVEKERDRLRDARASWTVKLGPLPASAAVVTGIAVAAAGKVHWGFAIAVGVVFILLLRVSTVSSGLKPYRKLRRDSQAAFDPFNGGSIVFREHETRLEEWLRHKVQLEAQVYDPLAAALDRERGAANLVQGLFLLIIAILIVGLAVS